MPNLVLLRHGQSVWNKENIFTGWVDVSLTPEGIEEALEAGKEIEDISFDVVFTSELKRAQATAILALSKSKESCCPVFMHEDRVDVEKYKLPEEISNILPVFVNKALNERHYGDLQGKNKKKLLEEVGEEQFKIWRRSYDISPPNGESLEETISRCLPYFEQKIVPYLVQGKTVLISAHGNSLRGIIKEIENISDEDIVSLEIPTGVPIVYQFDEGMWIKTKK